MIDSIHLPITDASQVGEARRSAARFAEDAALDERRAGELAIIVTELATNLSRYARTGAILLQSLQSARGTAVEILSVDAGPGMQDVKACLRDGYSTGGTPGNGLGAVKRLSSEFDIFSLPDRGTVVLSRVHVNADPPPGGVSWGVVYRPAPGETACGDTWRIIENDQRVAILMADGLGHGPLAAEAAQAVAEVFMENPFVAPASFMTAAHTRVGGTRGAAGAAAQVDIASKALRYCGVGNISGALLTANDSRGLFTHNGTIGMRTGKVQEFEYAWPAGGLLVMHSDGLQSRWDLENYPGLYLRHPAIIAAWLARDFTRGKDDVSVLVMRLRA